MCLLVLLLGYDFMGEISRYDTKGLLRVYKGGNRCLGVFSEVGKGPLF